MLPFSGAGRWAFSHASLTPSGRGRVSEGKEEIEWDLGCEVVRV